MATVYKAQVCIMLLKEILPSNINKELEFHAEAECLQTGKSSSTLGGILRIGLLSKKLTGFKSKLEDTVGMIGKSSWHGM